MSPTQPHVEIFQHNHMANKLIMPRHHFESCKQFKGLQHPIACTTKVQYLFWSYDRIQSTLLSNLLASARNLCHKHLTRLYWKSPTGCIKYRFVLQYNKHFHYVIHLHNSQDKEWNFPVNPVHISMTFQGHLLVSTFTYTGPRMVLL